MDGGAWQATGPGVAPSRTGLSSRAEARKLGPGETPPAGQDSGSSLRASHTGRTLLHFPESPHTFLRLSETELPH